MSEDWKPHRCWPHRVKKTGLGRLQLRSKADRRHRHFSNVSGPKGVFPERKGDPCHCTSRTPQNRLRLHSRQLGSLRRPPRPSGGDTSRVETVLTGSTGHAIQDPRRAWHARARRIVRHRLFGREMNLQRRTTHHTLGPRTDRRDKWGAGVQHLHGGSRGTVGPSWRLYPRDVPGLLHKGQCAGSGGCHPLPPAPAASNISTTNDRLRQQHGSGIVDAAILNAQSEIDLISSTLSEASQTREIRHFCDIYRNFVLQEAFVFC